MTAKRFKHSEIIQDDGQVICYGIEDTQTRHIFNVPFVDDGLYEVSEKELIKLLNELHEENEQLREHFIYLIGTALEDKECRKIYAEGLLEIFDDCANLDEAKIKIKEYLE